MTNKLQHIKDLHIPNAFTLEISVLGRYQGNGEAIVVHLYKDAWMIIDSFMFGNVPAPIYYLRERGFKEDDWAKVKYIVCTHWHSDHIVGLDKVVERCPNAVFIHMQTGKELLHKIVSDAVLSPKEIDEGSCKMLIKCLETTQNPDVGGVATNSTFIVNKEACHNIYDITISAISPSNSAVTTFCNAVALQNLDAFKNENINKLSIGLLIQSMWWKTLLAGDLEKGEGDCASCNVFGNNIVSGWCYAIAYGNSLRNIKCHNGISYLKIAHHGSDTGYCQKLFNKYVKKWSTGTTTSYATQRLPREDMLRLYGSVFKHHFFSLCGANSEQEEGQSDLDNSPKTKVVIKDNKLGIIVSRRFLNFPWVTRCYGNAGMYNKYNLRCIRKIYNMHVKIWFWLTNQLHGNC